MATPTTRIEQLFLILSVVAWMVSGHSRPKSTTYDPILAIYEGLAAQQGPILSEAQRVSNLGPASWKNHTMAIRVHQTFNGTSAITTVDTNVTGTATQMGCNNTDVEGAGSQGCVPKVSASYEGQGWKTVQRQWSDNGTKTVIQTGHNGTQTIIEGAQAEIVTDTTPPPEVATNTTPQPEVTTNTTPPLKLKSDMDKQDIHSGAWTTGSESNFSEFPFAGGRAIETKALEPDSEVFTWGTPRTFKMDPEAHPVERRSPEAENPETHQERSEDHTHRGRSEQFLDSDMEWPPARTGNRVRSPPFDEPDGPRMRRVTYIVRRRPVTQIARGK